MGCHRIGNDPNTSVTNSFLESHEVKNLYIASSGSFPTSGISNPTLTGVALALRMAHQILV
jgi:choline dehydrogenase-like flavoprotein